MKDQRKELGGKRNQVETLTILTHQMHFMKSLGLKNKKTNEMPNSYSYLLSEIG